VRLAGGTEQIDQGLKLRGGQMTELLGVAIANRLIECFEERKAGFRDAHLHDAAIIGHSVPGDQLSLFEAVYQPRDVGRVGNEFPREDESRQGSGMLSSQKPQGVVLLARQIVLLEQLVFPHSKTVVGSPKV
jgi:hypothetical protein